MSSSRQSNTVNSFLLLLLLVAIINMFTGIIPLFPWAIVILLSHFFTLKKHDWAFAFCMFSGVFGAFFAQHGIRGVGTVLEWIGVLVLVMDILQQSGKLKKPILLLLILLFVLFVSVIFSNGGSYAWEKYRYTFHNAFFCFVAFSHIMLYPGKHKGGALSLTLLIYAAFMMSFMSNSIGGLSLGDVFSFDSFRKALSEARFENEDLFLYNYQQIGFVACIGLCLFYYDKQRNLDYLGWIILLSTGLIVLSCQSRQGLFTFVMLLLLLMVDLRKFRIRNILIFWGVLLLAYFWLDTLDDKTFEFVTGVNEFESSSARSSIRHAAWLQFLSHPVLGVGYGGFLFEGIYGVNVHNLFYEILAETGIVGASVFLILSLDAIGNRRNADLIGENKWLLAILMTFFLRLMISSDLREGIELFVILFMLPLLSNNNKQQIVS